MDVQVLEETARLAHLTADAHELAAALPAFAQMLGFFAAMAGADDDPSFAAGADGAAAGQAAGARLVGAGHFRGDAAPRGLNAGFGAANAGALNEALLNNAGERDGRFIVIPNVL
ncbi:MAG: aspartyl/glutamyl-tRNA amidotransferase subunit C [Treponema sp.]|jgi:aspartyl-tRNA(Asn)/glutamyl-tRNA(Gln) amidotransferase subunit C|nr:aspartyl/glutamyl-tRNA amidotransferase subunit C [Treponema sp.]